MKKAICYGLVLFLMASLLAGCEDKNSKKTKSYTREENVDLNDPDSISNLNPKGLSGTMTFGELLKKSEKSPVVFYEIEGTPGTSGIVSKVYLFTKGNVLVYDQACIGDSFGARKDTDVVKTEQGKLIEQLTKSYMKFSSQKIMSEMELKNNPDGVDFLLVLKGASQ